MKAQDASSGGKRVYAIKKIKKEDYDFLKQKIEEIYAANSDKPRFGEKQATQILHRIVPPKYRVSHSVVSRIHATSCYDEYREITMRYSENKRKKELEKRAAEETVIPAEPEEEIGSTMIDEQKLLIQMEEPHETLTTDRDWMDKQFSGIVAAMEDLMIVPASSDGKFQKKTAGKALDQIGATCNTIKKIINENVVPKEAEILTALNDLNNTLEKLYVVLQENVKIDNENNEAFEHRFDVIESKLDHLVGMCEPSVSSANI